MQKSIFGKYLCLHLILSVFILTLPAQGWAMFIPSGEAISAKEADLMTIQKSLESSVIKQRLMEYGLTAEEAMHQISKLSDNQIHEFASNLESLQAGADGLGTLIFIVLVAILVVLVLQATGHKIIIR